MTRHLGRGGSRRSLRLGFFIGLLVLARESQTASGGRSLLVSPAKGGKKNFFEHAIKIPFNSYLFLSYHFKLFEFKGLILFTSSMSHVHGPLYSRLLVMCAAQNRFVLFPVALSHALELIGRLRV